jgi:two-component system sensor kinase FixL
MSDDRPLPLGDPARVLAALLDISEDAILGVDLNGSIVSWNRGAEKLYGYAAAEMIGASVSRIIPPDRAGELPWILDRLRSGTSIKPYETVRLARDGRPVDVSLSVVPIADRSGLIVGATAIARDISSRLHADFVQRTTEARWRAILDSTVDAIIVIDAHGVVEAYNKAAEGMFGYQEEDVLGQNVRILMPSPYHDEHDAYIARYLQTGEPRIIGIGREVIARRHDGSTFPVHLSVGELRVGTERHFTGILHDLTKRVALEEQLREQSTLARLGEMAAVVAHEVKNPLTAVRGAVQVIGKRLPADSREAPVVAEIITRLDSLNALLKDLLLFARTPQPQMKPLDLVSLLRLTAELLGRDPALSAARIEIIGAAPTISGDPELLKIVFQNLMINAAQAMQGQGQIRITVSSGNGSCQVLVADEGPGIPPEAREKLFRPFFTTKARGTGLGLPTAKRLVEIHGGSIAIACPPAGGTVVSVMLPTAAAGEDDKRI